DQDGRFEFFLAGDAAFEVSVDRIGAVNSRTYRLLPKAEENVVQLIEGTTVTGHVLRDSRGGAGVEVVLESLWPAPGRKTDRHEPKSAAQVRFVFEHLDPQREFQLLTKMASAAEHGMAIRREIFTASDGNITEVGELNLYPGNRVTGRIVFEDGGPDVHELH